MDEWDAMKILDRYVLDYMIKRKMTKAAEIFEKEANIEQTDVAINSPDGFLSEWWSIFWDMYISRILNQLTSSGEEVAKTIDNNAQNASPNPPSSEMISQAFNNLLSNMQMSEMNNQQTFDAIPIPPQTNQETVATLQPSIPNPSMSLSTTLTTTLTMLQPSTLNSVMNQSAVVLMPPPSNSIPNTIINQQQALSGVLMQFPTSTPTPIMDQQTTMGRLLQFSNSSSVPPVAMGQCRAQH
ncbi:hypothetical protein M9H77_25903 [Catharanthus roseus]|uniref:Uncharacterized protein n=1 Tax=Catharanthus roseus TaxID=4058 RepID=A0ACC0AA16_CATRO|nr:hypothetical protein M9H77_25903 [Catharanthus roseus]